MTGDLPPTPLGRVSHSQPDLAVLDMAVHLARTTLEGGAPPPRGTLADMSALGARHGLDEQGVRYGLRIWAEMQALRWSPDGTRFGFVLAPGP
eukprot:11476182-Alexandrium_andersonii.AAC.1